MRMMRALLIAGGTAALVAMPREDYAQSWSAAKAAARNASVLIDKHLIRPVMVSVAERKSEPRLAVPEPRPAIRPSLIGSGARAELSHVTIPEAQSATGTAIAAVPAHANVAVPPSATSAVERLMPAPVRVAENLKATYGSGSSNDAVALSTGAAAVPAAATDVAQLSRVAEVPAVPARAPQPVPAEFAAATDTKMPSAIGTTDQTNGDDDVAVAPPVPSPKPEVPENKKPPVAAKLLFGAAKGAAPLSARAIGYYSRGCLAGAKALPIDGAAWQAMRLSRNRNWGHPDLVSLIEKLARDVQKEDGWPGLLVGDMSQPRGGPMLTGHASHQIGLDADIWFTPMPGRRLSRRERENLSATSMIDGPLKVDPTAFTPSHVRVVKRAASYPEVERILVHPAIKKALCEAAGKDRAWLAKVRPYYGHFYHFHVRIGCPKGSTDCRSQRPTTGKDGCDKELDDWFATLTRPPRKPPPGYKPPPPKPPTVLADLPKECRVVLDAGSKAEIVDQAELVKSSIERSKQIIDISGKPRSEALANKLKR